MTEYAADCGSTALRIARLEEYFKVSVLDNGKFICSNEGECRPSHRGSFYAGQLPHVGTHYDLARNGVPFRIVVVGQEYGTGDELVDLSTRRAMIGDDSGMRSRFFAEPDLNLKGRNSHMRGCTSLLRLLFSKGLGRDHKDEFIQLNGAAVHLFQCFALVNFLLCSAVLPRGGKRGRSTPTMRRNCAHHFRAQIESLEPTIIAVQGRGVLRWMNAAHYGLSNEVVQSVPINGRDVCVLAFTHPSAHGTLNWGVNDQTEYLDDTVAPAVQRVLQEYF